MPPLPRETMEKVLQTIRRDVAEDKVKIDTPTQNLESYFLDVVQKARQSAAETSGATSGNRVAAYLRGDGEQASPSAKVLERLMQPAATSASEPAVAAVADPVDSARLESLAKPTPAAEPQAPKADPTPAADLSKANEKLASLLGKPK